MRLSLKQKQVLGVTVMVALIVIALSLLQLITTAGVLLTESRDRFELFGSAVYSQAASAITSPETAYHDLRTSPSSSRRCNRRCIRRTSSMPSSSIRPAP